jgi:serine/threonine protein kinase
MDPTRSAGLSREQYERLQTLVDDACECPPKMRRQYLAGACASDTGLLQEALALLDAHEAIEPDDDELLPSGTRVGAYRVERELGRGGMGAVYLARRDDDVFEKRVAIKVAQSASNETEIRDRFNRERRILALLDHPNIARLIDAGTTESGHPYFVMEYVEGVPVTTYADRCQLSIAERLELFRVVCGAVESAHKKQIVHRDIKPTNVLVTADGTPKLLDFGIAKALHGTSETDLTATNLSPGTPRYASPEQLRGSEVDARTDVYALGVVLFELLTSSHPFLTRSDGWVAVKPSDAVTGQATQLSLRQYEFQRAVDAIAADRRTTARTLIRLLQTDLDAIVVRALREDVCDRYQSATELSDNVRRALDRFARHRTLDRPFSWSWHRIVGAATTVGLMAVTTIWFLPQLQSPAESEPSPRQTTADVAIAGTIEPSPPPPPDPGRNPVRPTSAPSMTKRPGPGAETRFQPNSGTRGASPPVELRPPISPPATILTEPRRTDIATSPQPEGPPPEVPIDTNAVTSKLAELLREFVQAYSFESSGKMRELIPSLSLEGLTAMEAKWRQSDKRQLFQSDFQVTRIERDAASAVCVLTETRWNGDISTKMTERVRLQYSLSPDGWVFRTAPWPPSGRNEDTVVERE